MIKLQKSETNHPLEQGENINGFFASHLRGKCCECHPYETEILFKRFKGVATFMLKIYLIPSLLYRPCIALSNQ